MAEPPDSYERLFQQYDMDLHQGFTGSAYAPDAGAGGASLDQQQRQHYSSLAHNDLADVYMSTMSEAGNFSHFGSWTGAPAAHLQDDHVRKAYETAAATHRPSSSHYPFTTSSPSFNPSLMSSTSPMSDIFPLSAHGQGYHDDSSTSSRRPQSSHRQSTTHELSTGISPASTMSPSASLSQSPPAYVHNEALARILADAQFQARTQAQAAALQAYSSSYLATLDTLPIASTSANARSRVEASQLPRPSAAYLPPSVTPYPSSTTNAYAEVALADDAMRSNGDALKKRKVSEGPPRRTSAGHEGGFIAPSSTFDYSLPRPVTAPSISQSDPTARTSVDLIAKAGVTQSSQPLGPDGGRRRSQLPVIVPRAIAPQQSSAVPKQAPPISTEATRPSSSKGREPAPSQATTAAPKPEKPEKRRKSTEKGHNVVERRYRNNINAALADLRDAVPALRHLKPLPSMPASRRRASQFTLSGAAAAPTPEGLIDGIPAAKTLSKGVILVKAVEYISFLQGARTDSAEDIALFKAVVTEMVGGGSQIIDAFEARRAVLEVERERKRDVARREQQALDDAEDAEMGDDDDGDEVAAKDDSAQADLASPENASSSGSSESPLASMAGPSQSASRSNSGNRKVLGAGLAATFMGGLGLDNYATAAGEAAEIVSSRGWTGRLVRRSNPSNSSDPRVPALLSSDVLPSGILLATMLVGLVSTIIIALYILYPLFKRSRLSGKTTPAIDPSLEEKLVSEELPRSFYREKRRAEALASLARLNEQASDSPTYLDECTAALRARRHLLHLVGAPTYGLLPSLAREALATALRNVTTIRVGSFSSWSESDRLEAAVAWVRIAEIEAALGGAQINFVARCYTFLRLFNLSRHKSWPQTTPTTSRAAVNAVLALHLDRLGHPLSAAALWNQAAKADRKKSDMKLDPWVSLALSTKLDVVRSVLAVTKKSTDCPSPSDTVPLMRISEFRCEAALRECWARVFVGVCSTNSNQLSPIARFAAIIDQPALKDTVRHVVSATSIGSPVHALAEITLALCELHGSSPESAKVQGRQLLNAARAGGAVSRLGCASAFFTLVLEEGEWRPETCASTMEVDILASATLGWILSHNHSESLFTKADSHPTTSVNPSRPVSKGATSLRRGPRFRDPSLAAFLASPVADALQLLRSI